ncbi:Ctr copper transporter family-domain-containing protein [Mycena vulgaris]|nr:Ctr copper transporter family-domain-containing protein [Mycena vulgaris]
MDSMSSMNMTDIPSNSTNLDSMDHNDDEDVPAFYPGRHPHLQGHRPPTPGAIFAACLVFFVISIAERWLRAAARGVDARITQRTTLLATTYAFVDGAHASTGSGKESTPAPTRKFILSHELSRGVLAGLSTALHYLLMLVVMTFNAAFIVSIILGVIVGETAFGRLHHH